MTLNRLELLLGWLAVLLSVAIAAFTYFSGLIAPFAVQTDLLGFGVIVGAMALGVTLDGVFGGLIGWVGKVLLTLATLALLGIAAISFVIFFFVPALLAVGATILAFARPFVRQVPQATR